MPEQPEAGIQRKVLYRGVLHIFYMDAPTTYSILPGQYH